MDPCLHPVALARGRREAGDGEDGPALAHSVSAAAFDIPDVYTETADGLTHPRLGWAGAVEAQGGEREL